ncbi:hypothetical protein [Campylobacter sp.]|uniref:hypothetical protein n=1 Tax=Campylobacter sp. TaxID=205 RepID=UPI002A807F3D|nr:hypothetical protein [Campylobacter sp.]MCI6564361.1 hypothetical protein [Campylobacter sp.]MCI6579116.1 hypothetical protein [Campylobacter sp.]MCI7236428.1 hypothetical protein [Campylobacter sp.]MDY4803152.1 hypothetical protein [Campylobacter sp.]MDY4829322.1 hypothetical protein [Campylobacter sp.]
MNFGIEKLKNMPLCNRLLRNIHSELMLGLRGKYLGEFRKNQKLDRQTRLKAKKCELHTTSTA